MRLLLFSDLHCDQEAARSLMERADDVDVLVGAGDFATCRRGIQQTLEILRHSSRPTVLVAGNAETDEELRRACQGWSRAHVLHGSAATIDDVPFFGMGGAVPVTPFGAWSYDLTEAEARDLLADCPSDAILVTHSPPQGAVDRSSRGPSLGSVAIRETIEQNHPRLAVCGHIHDCSGRTERIGTTPVINAGPRGIVWDLEAGEVVER